MRANTMKIKWVGFDGHGRWIEALEGDFVQDFALRNLSLDENEYVPLRTVSLLLTRKGECVKTTRGMRLHDGDTLRAVPRASTAVVEDDGAEA